MWRTAARVVAVAVLLATATPLVTPAAEATTRGDNGVLAFVRFRPSGCSDLRTVQVAGTGARTLSNCPQYIGQPAWDPSGKQLAVSYIHGSGAERLALLPATGGTPQVVATTVSHARSPSFDRTGQVLAFTGGDIGPDQRALYTVAVTGGTATRITPSGNTDVNDEPDYSPTAAEIAWTRRTAASYDVWTVTVDAQGRNPTARINLTKGMGNSRYPSWSPDGSRLAFASDRSGTWQIYVMSATGADVTQVTMGSQPHIQPVWSPDGTMLAFTTGCTTSDCTTPNGRVLNGNLRVIDVSDVANPGMPRTVIGTSAAEFDPQWGRACASATCPAAASLPRKVSLAAFGHSLKARGSLSSTKSVCVSRVPVVLQYENVIHRGNSNVNKHWLTEGKTRTSRSGAYHLPLPPLLTGWYRVIVPAQRLGETECAGVVTRIRQNLAVRDKRGDSRGPVDLTLSWTSVHNGVITHTIRTVDPFSTGNLVGRPCLPVFFFTNDGHSYGGSIGCAGGVQFQDQHKPVTIRRPDSRTITYSFKWSELPKKFAFYEWVPWSRGTSDADWWDVIPNDSDVGTDRPPGNPRDMPYLFRKKP